MFLPTSSKISESTDLLIPITEQYETSSAKRKCTVHPLVAIEKKVNLLLPNFQRSFRDPKYLKISGK